MNDVQTDQKLSTKFSIEIDCEPCTPRPDTILPDALNGTDLTVDDFKKVSTFFGNWTYVPFESKDEAYAKAQPAIEKNLRNAYDQGRCRYCSW